MPFIDYNPYSFLKKPEFLKIQDHKQVQQALFQIVSNGTRIASATAVERKIDDA